MKPLSLLIISLAFCLGASGQGDTLVKADKMTKKTVVGEWLYADSTYYNRFYIYKNHKYKCISTYKGDTAYSFRGKWNIKNDTLTLENNMWDESLLVFIFSGKKLCEISAKTQTKARYYHRIRNGKPRMVNKF